MLVASPKTYFRHTCVPNRVRAVFKQLLKSGFPQVRENWKKAWNLTGQEKKF